jgi:hypothetical protein
MSKFERFMEKHKMLEWDMYTTEDMENLYKLVIENCAEFIDSMDHSSQYFPHVAAAIKEHFGVEE